MIPPFLWLARRFPLERGTWRRHGPIHLAASAVAVIGKYAVLVPVLNTLAPRTNATLTSLLVANALTDLIFNWSVIGVIHAVEFYRRYRERESVALQLASELSRAQLEVLRAQLQPHFLFNTLNAIATLMHRDPDGADSMLNRLADLLRATLHANASHEWPLREELEVARAYVDIMLRRYGSRVSAEWEVAEGIDDVLVPTFVLQPLIENAFEHGIDGDGSTLLIRIAASERAGRLRLTVRDDGPGAANGPEGIGLSNTRRRLAELYRESATLHLVGRKGGGTEASVELPTRASGRMIWLPARAAHV
jgi:LytS/YehU family sensor histidine kinase